jgi:hypothetical protein
MFNLCVLVVKAKSDKFIIDNDYKILLNLPVKQTTNSIPVGEAKNTTDAVKI